MQAWIWSFRPQQLGLVSRPMVQLFGSRQFLFPPKPISFGKPLSFEWQPLDSTLPSLRGAITLHRFGPIALLGIKAAFDTGDDLAGRLLHESVATEMGRRSLRYLRTGLQRAVTAPLKQGDPHARIRHA